MDINSLAIKNKSTYVIDNISHIDDFNVNLLRVTKKESRIDANIYYIRRTLSKYDDTIIPIFFY